MIARDDSTPEVPVPEWTVEGARVQIRTAITVLELAAEALAKLPAPQVALRLGHRELFRYYQTAETMMGWLVGHGATASVKEPEPGSALGDGRRICSWTPGELDRHYCAALEDLHVG